MPLLALLTLSAACSSSAAPAQQRTLVLALPAGTSPSSVSAAAPVAAALSRATGARVRLEAPASVESLAPDLKRGRVDAALLSVPTYVAVSAATPVRVVAQAVVEPPPPPVLLCNAASGVAPLTDGGDWSSLRGKTLLLGPHGSLATNTWPRYFMTRNGIDPLGDVASVRIVGDERRALLDVYNGIADCTAASSDVRGSIADIAPDVAQRIAVAFTAPVSIPPPPVVVRDGLSPALQRKLAAALAAIKPGTPASAALSAVAGFASARPAADGDYAVLRAAARSGAA